MKKLMFSAFLSLAFLVFGVTISSASDFKSGMVVASMDKCGAGKCGANMFDAMAKDSAMKCGVGKCGNASK